MAYATGEDLIARYDARDIGGLVSDDNNQVSPIDLPDDPYVAQSLEDASGDVESALLVGNRYSTTELAGLTGNSLATLKRIVCDIAMSYLLGRRAGQDPARLEGQAKLAYAHLERLRKGENVFNLDDQKLAGAPTIDGPTLATYNRLNMLRDRTRNYYPARRTPGDR